MGSMMSKLVQAAGSKIFRFHITQGVVIYALALFHPFMELAINYKVNAGGASPWPQLADMYGVTVYPTLMFVDGKGKIMLKHEGAATASQLLEMAIYLHEAVKEEISLGTW